MINDVREVLAIVRRLIEVTLCLKNVLLSRDLKNVPKWILS